MEKIKNSNRKIVQENIELRAKLAEAEETLDAIKRGEVDALVTTGPEGDGIFTLKGADYIYRIFLETMNEGAATLSADGTLLYCNKRLAEMLDVSLEKIVGSSILEYVYSADRSHFASFLERGLSKTSREEIMLVRSNGAPLPVNVSCGSLDIEPACVSIIVTDLSELKKAASEITDRKRSERILLKDNETLERLAEEKAAELFETQMALEKSKRLSDIGTLAATIAHEMRNPLAAIKVGIYNIRRKAGNPDLAVHFERIEKKIAESNQIINNLLAYAKIKNPVYEKIAIDDLLSECIEIAQKRYSGKSSAIRKNKVDSVIEADPVQMKELFNNIINNAVDAIPDDGRIEITVDDAPKNVITISVKDNGSGIAKENLEHIFDPFFTTKSKGTGLGLAVCKQIAELHRGDMKVSSETGKGTTVYVELPRASARMNL